MGNLGHQAARLAASKICDNIVKGLCKDPETEVVKLIDMWQKFMGDEKIDLNYDSARKMICDKDCTLNKYMHRLINEIDPHVLKTIALNLGFEAFVYGTKTIRKNREKYGCNVPWLILMDPTSACNLHCTGCWAAEYGHKLNLTFDEMDKVVTQGKELGVYLYMFTGGEPLVRRICTPLVKKLKAIHGICQVTLTTNGILLGEQLPGLMEAGLDADTQAQISHAALRGWALGEPDFIENLQQKTERRVKRQKAGRPAARTASVHED